MFSSNSFRVSGFTLRSLTHLELTFVQGERKGSSFILLQVDIEFCQHHLLKVLSIFLQVCSWHLVKYHLAVILCTHVWVLSFVPLIYKSISLPLSCCFYDYTSIILFKVWPGIVISPSSLFELRIALANLSEILHSYINMNKNLYKT